MRIGPGYDAKCVEMYNSSGHVIPWMNEFSYFNAHWMSLKSFYRAANAVFERVGRTASE